MQITPLHGASDIGELPSLVEYRYTCDRTMVLEAVTKTGSNGATVITPFATAHYILATVGSINTYGRESLMLDLISVVAARLHELYKDGLLLRAVSDDEDACYKFVRCGH